MPLGWVAVAFMSGIGLNWGFQSSLGFLLGAGLFLGLALCRFRNRPRVANLLLLSLALLLGGLRGWVDAQAPAHSIAQGLGQEPRPITCEGVLASDVEWIHPADRPAHRQGWLRITRIRNQEEWISSSGQVFLKLHAHNVPLAYGDRLHLSGFIRGPRPVLENGEEKGRGRFNEGQWLWIHGASGILTITESEAITRLDAPAGPAIRYRRWVASFRERLKGAGRILLGPLEAAYLAAFLLGDGRGIPREVWEAFKRTGTVHVLVVSGQHVALIGSMIFVLLSLIRIPRTLQYLWVMGALILYCPLTGGNPPILRGTLMGILFCFGRLRGDETSPLNSLGLAALLILTADPRALADVSFQLSFAAVLGLFGLSPWFLARMKAPDEADSDPETSLRRRGRLLWRWIAQGLSASAGAWLAITPLVAWHFHRFTPIALIANLIVVPWASLLIAIGFVLYFVAPFNGSAAAPFAASFSWAVFGLNRLVGWLSHIPYASWQW